MKEPNTHNEELIRVIACFEQRVGDHHPTLVPFFEQQLQDTLL